jgi:hypothetical protein
VAQINLSSTGTSGVATPDAGVVAIFSNSGDDGNLYLKKNDGSFVEIGSGGGGAGSSGTSGTSGGSSGSGSSGTSGTTGANGSSGTSGVAGNNGSSGTSGTGVSGSAGTSGTSGSGSSGTSGDAGSSGTSGTGGEGSSGTSGTQGAPGATGSSGTSGTQGATGSSGTSGTQGAPGATGSSGTSGTQGATGSSGTSGTQGAPGDTGSSGTSGTGGAGSSGTSGTQGAAGATGSSGTSGTGGSGSSGTSGTGVSGSSGTSGSAGTSGAPGATGSSGTSGTGGGGGGGVSTVFASTNRYSYTSGSNETTIMSSGTVYGGLTWFRSSTTLTVTSTAHGLTTGDYVLIRNMSADYQYLPIIVSDSNTFTVTVADAGGASGNEGAYVPCFEVTALTENNITLVSPSAGNCQLISINTYLQEPASNPAITVPAGISNGAGINTSLNTKNIPVATAFKTSDGGPYTTFGYTFSTVGNYNVINTSGVDNEINCIIKVVY